MKKIILMFFLAFFTIASFPTFAQNLPFSQLTKEQKDERCRQACGHKGFFYDRMGAKFAGQEIVCTRYPDPCGYNCTKGWNIRYAESLGNPYTCQTAVQN